MLALAISLVSATPPPILDIHMHASEPAGFGGPQTVCTNEERLESPPIDPREEMTVQKALLCPTPIMSVKSEAENIRRTVEIMERRNVYAVLDSTDEDLATSRIRFVRWSKASPNRFLPAFDFGDADPAELGALETAVKRGEIVVFSEISPQYAGELATIERLDRYFALAERLDVPVGIHLGEGPPGGRHVAPGNYLVSAGRPTDLEPLLVKYPKLRVNVMHFGSPFVDEMIGILYSHPQVYVDIAQNNWGFPRAHFYSQLKRLVDAGFSKRIMFGSDSMIWPETIEIAIDTIEKAPFLSAQQKRDIFYNNAARFLRFTPEQIARHHRGR